MSDTTPEHIYREPEVFTAPGPLCILDDRGFCSHHLAVHVDSPMVRPYILAVPTLQGDAPVQLSAQLAEVNWLQDILREAILAAEQREAKGLAVSPDAEELRAVFYRWAAEAANQTQHLFPAGGAVTGEPA